MLSVCLAVWSTSGGCFIISSLICTLRLATLMCSAYELSGDFGEQVRIERGKDRQPALTVYLFFDIWPLQ